MELKTLWLGLLISMGAFAVKTGLGWAYLWGECNPNRKAVATLAVVGVYGLMFAGVYWLVTGVNLMVHYDILLPLWQGGVTLHWLVAGLLLLWGLLLLKSKPNNCAHSRGWLALVIPCPVCLSVVLMSAAGLALYFPDQAGQAVAGLFLAFLAVALVSGLTTILGRKISNDSPETTLGLVMVLMAAYFIISALVMPQFSDISKVYRLAAYAGETRQADLFTNLTTIGGILLFMGLGFYTTRSRLRLQKGRQAQPGRSGGRP